jgi:hypothetical protein
MRRTCLLLAGLAGLLPARPRAEWVVGARGAYAMPFGSKDGTATMRDTVSPQVFPEVDAGYRFKRLTLSAYVSYGFGSVSGALKDNCAAAGQSCSSTSLRIGGLLSYAFVRPGDRVEPWLAAGLGYEDMTVKRLSSAWVRGSEVFVQGGADWRAGEAFTVGPYASLSVGAYTDAVGGGVQSGTIQDQRFHEWVTLGIRGTFEFAR